MAVGKASGPFTIAELDEELDDELEELEEELEEAELALKTCVTFAACCCAVSVVLSGDALLDAAIFAVVIFAVATFATEASVWFKGAVATTSTELFLPSFVCIDAGTTCSFVVATLLTALIEFIKHLMSYNFGRDSGSRTRTNDPRIMIPLL